MAGFRFDTDACPDRDGALLDSGGANNRRLIVAKDGFVLLLQCAVSGESLDLGEPADELHTPQGELDLFGTSLFGINGIEIKLGGENLRFAAREPELRVSSSSIAMRGTPFGQPTLPRESGGHRMV